MPVGSTQTIDLVADEPWDWAFHQLPMAMHFLLGRPLDQEVLIGFTVDQFTGALMLMPSTFLAGVNQQGMALIRVP